MMIPLCTTTKPLSGSERWGWLLTSLGTPWVAQRVCAIPQWMSTLRSVSSSLLSGNRKKYYVSSDVFRCIKKKITRNNWVIFIQQSKPKKKLLLIKIRLKIFQKCFYHSTENYRILININNIFHPTQNVKEKNTFDLSTETQQIIININKIEEKVGYKWYNDFRFSSYNKQFLFHWQWCLVMIWISIQNVLIHFSYFTG